MSRGKGNVKNGTQNMERQMRNIEHVCQMRNVKLGTPNLEPVTQYVKSVTRNLKPGT